MSKTKIIPLDQIKPDPNNANMGTQRGLGVLEKSMREHGFVEAGVLDKNNQIIGGNKRTETAAAIGLPDEAIVIEHDGEKPIYIKLPHVDLDTEEGRKLAYRLNRVAQLDINFDPEQLQLDLDSGLDLSDLFTDLELGDLGVDVVEEPQEAPEPQIDKADELQKVWQVQVGDLWRMGSHLLICGDCTNREVVSRLMGGDSASLCVTDPPYNVGVNYGEHTNDNRGFDEYQFWCRKWLNFLPKKRIFSVGIKRLFWWGDIAGFPQWVIAWVKRNGQGNTPLGGTNKWDAFLIYGCEPDGGIDVIEVNNDYSENIKSQGGHPTAKPVELWEKLVSRWSVKGDVILDPFAGSGTTGIAAERLKRKSRMIEISPKYCAVILERFKDLGLQPELVERA